MGIPQDDAGAGFGSAAAVEPRVFRFPGTSVAPCQDEAGFFAVPDGEDVHSAFEVEELRPAGGVFENIRHLLGREGHVGHTEELRVFESLHFFLLFAAADEIVELNGAEEAGCFIAHDRAAGSLRGSASEVAEVRPEIVEAAAGVRLAGPGNFLGFSGAGHFLTSHGLGEAEDAKG